MPYVKLLFSILDMQYYEYLYFVTGHVLSPMGLKQVSRVAVVSPETFFHPKRPARCTESFLPLHPAAFFYCSP